MDDERIINIKFVYTLIIIILITMAALTIINSVNNMGKELRGSSWYIYCDMEHKSCSCNVYGMFGDTPSNNAMTFCVAFMKEYNTRPENIAPIITSIDAEVIK